MRKSIDGKDIAELIGVVAIVASLIFVGLQLRQDRVVARAEATQSSESSATEVNTMIAEYAGVWLKGRNDETLSETELIIMRRLVDTLYRRARYTAQMRRQLGIGGQAKASLQDLAVLLHENPGAKRIWESLTKTEMMYFEHMRPRDEFRRNYRDEVLAELAKLDGFEN